MLSYEHIFHAGNHADILKHFSLFLLLSFFNKKEKPYTLIDTHAGCGIYNVDDERAKKTNEAQSGIIRVLDFLEKNKFSTNENANNFLSYVNFEKKYLQKNLYAGSAEIENFLMNETCELVLCEWHKKQFADLQMNFQNAQSRAQNFLAENKFANEHFSNEKNECENFLNKKKFPHVRFFNEDFETVFKKVLPPKIKRGLIFMDASFEEKNEYEKIENACSFAMKKWNVGSFAIWYPLVLHRKNELLQMKETIVLSAKKFLQNAHSFSVEIKVRDENEYVEKKLSERTKMDAPRLYGSGMLFVSSPYRFLETMQANGSLLADALGAMSCQLSVVRNRE